MSKRFLIRILPAAFVAVAIAFALPLLLESRMPEHGGLRLDGRPHRTLKKKPSDWFMIQRIWPGDTLNRPAVETARAQALRLRAASRALDVPPWDFSGPSNVGGRITALAVHPSAPDTVYAGAALGGVFKSVDGGLNYFPVFNDDFALSTGALAMDPSNPMRIWLGTGEANSSGDSYGGMGIYLSEDGGRTWQHKGLEESRHIGKIAIDPTDPNRVYVAAAGELFTTNPERGLYRTTNSGTTWERVLYLTDSTACIDVALNPQRPDTVFAVMWERIRRPHDRRVGGVTSGIWRSFDGGNNWTRLTTGLPSGATVGRGGIAVSPVNPNRLYAIFADNPGNLLGIYRSTNGGDSWTTTTNPSGTLYSSFGWYFGQIHTDPSNVDLVYVQGVDMFRSANGGNSWSQVFSNAHVDHHALWIDPNNTAHLITGHDGGINVSYNSGSSSTQFSDLPVTQFYAISADPTLSYRLYGGTQDNSTPRTLTGATEDWEVLFYGDGFYCLVDPRDSDVIYAEAQYGYLGKCYDGGYDWYFIANDFYDDRTNWMTPYLISPHNPDVLFVGTYRVWKSTNAGDSWTAISNDLTSGPGPGTLVYGTITTLAQSPADPQVIYAGTDDAHVWVTANGGGSWTEISTGLPERWVTRVAPHPDSAGVVYVSFSGYKEVDYQPHLFRSGDYGATWADVGAGLPECPINDVIVDPDRPSHLYVGSDFGVFYTPDWGQHWYALEDGLPMSAIFDMEFIPSTRKLVAGTHGRSMWTLDLGGAVAGPPQQVVLATNGVLRWSRAGGETAFTVYGSDTPSGEGDSLVTVSDTVWTDPDFSSRVTPYFYYVRGRAEP